jgi:hypothetical protein
MLRNRVAYSAIALIGSLFAIHRAMAQLVETEIEVALAPILDVVAVEDDAKIYRAAPGATVQMQVTARRSDGSSHDVTLDSGTAYSSLSPDLVSVSSGGALTFASPPPAGETAAMVIVTRNGHTRALGFNVASQ